MMKYPSGIKKIPAAQEIHPSLAGSREVLDLKIAMATLEFHIENTNSLHIVREFENRARKLMKKAEAKREHLQENSNT